MYYIEFRRSFPSSFSFGAAASTLGRRSTGGGGSPVRKSGFGARNGGLSRAATASGSSRGSSSCRRRSSCTPPSSGRGRSRGSWTHCATRGPSPPKSGTSSGNHRSTSYSRCSGLAPNRAYVTTRSYSSIHRKSGGGSRRGTNTGSPARTASWPTSSRSRASTRKSGGCSGSRGSEAILSASSCTTRGGGSYTNASGASSRLGTRRCSGCDHGWLKNCARCGPALGRGRTAPRGSGRESSGLSTRKRRRSGTNRTSGRHSATRACRWGGGSGRSGDDHWTLTPRSRTTIPAGVIAGNSRRGCGGGASSRGGRSLWPSSSWSSASGNSKTAHRTSNTTRAADASTSRSGPASCPTKRGSLNASTRCSAIRQSC